MGANSTHPNALTLPDARRGDVLVPEPTEALELFEGSRRVDSLGRGHPARNRTIRLIRV